MSIWLILGEVSLGLLTLLVLIFAVYSLAEKEGRAFWRSALLFVSLLVIQAALLVIREPVRSWLGGCIFVFSGLVFLTMVFYPLKRQALEIVGDQKKIDERDVIFARFDYEEGTEIFKQYYQSRPEYREMDEKIRKLPDLFSPSHLVKNPWLFSLADMEFNFLEHQLTQVDGAVSADRVEVAPAENTRCIKSIINYLGSDVCGICRLDQAYVYSHVGRGPEPYGQEIKNTHAYAVVFALEMDLGMVQAAPKAPVVVETGKMYVEGARISIITAGLIRRLGYPARAHTAGSNYQIILPLMFACTISLVISALLSSESIYTLKLVRRGVNIYGGKELNVLRRLRVSQVMIPEIELVSPSTPLAELATRMMSSSHSHFFVVEDDKRIHGHISLENLRPILKDYEALCDVIIASDLMNHDVTVVKADESLDMVMQVFGKFELDEIPVVDNGQLVGTVRRSDVIEAYNRETIKLDVASGLATSLRLQKKMQSKRLAVAGGFIILEVRTPRIFVDKSLDVLDLRERFGATVLTIKREIEEGEDKVSYLLPTSSTIIKEGDVLIIFGLQKDLSRFPHD